jgi:hypothetical protein
MNIFKIEKKQEYLINKTKNYFSFLKKRKIDLSRSSFCYIITYGRSPGFGILLIWLKEKFSKILFISYVLKNIILISTLSNFRIHRINNKIKYSKVIFTWAKMSNFKKGTFYDSFSNLNSKNAVDILFFIIYSDYILPNQIPKNVIIFYKLNHKFNYIFFFNILFNKIKYLFSRSFSFFHFFSYNTIFAEIIYKHFLDNINLKTIKKVIMPYEGQTFQNFIFKNIKNKNKKIKTVGFIHSMIPALPLNFIKREGAPDALYVSGFSQKNIFIKYLGWNNKDINITRSVRIKKKIRAKQHQTFYFPMNIFKLNEINSSIDKYFKFLKKNSLPHFQIKKHPQMLNVSEQIVLFKKINFLFLNYKNKFSKTVKKKISFFLGPTSSPLQFLENNFESLHITVMPILDLYTNRLWKFIKPVEVSDYIYKYSLLKKKKIIKLSNQNYNLKTAKIL